MATKIPGSLVERGGRNTKKFHILANGHRRSNHTGRIRVEGVELWWEEEVSNGIVSFYQKLYTEPLGWRPKLDGLPFDAFSELEREGLKLPFTEEEVPKALSSCNGDKVLGPDGFTMHFFIESWAVVRGEVMGTFQEFHSTGVFEKSLNASFIALIPKKGSTSDIKDFRLISLVGCECVDSRLGNGVPGVLCKLDIEKAYDHVNWNFLLYLLQRMGFGSKWRKWIETCLSFVKFSILVNVLGE
ncbi:uncharacterized protein LOC132301504 [Cornus florida]|uniref:uncharacterized protein LOC132301504 n=1 Tax=Cornus florida TaxID=4283 RepID=UPI0028979ED4|nr:uncharacterized protein LOC132301504 [Cornus florida]